MKRNRCKEYSLFFLMSLLFLSCGGLEEVDKRDTYNLAIKELDEMKKQWDASKPRSYTYAVAVSCFCTAPTNGPFQIEIVNNQADTAYYFDFEVIKNSVSIISPNYDSASLVAQVPELTRDLYIDSLFSSIRSTIESRPDDFTVFYDTIYAYPRYARFDVDTLVADDEFGHIINRFEVSTQ